MHACARTLKTSKWPWESFANESVSKRERLSPVHVRSGNKVKKRLGHVSACVCVLLHACHCVCVCGGWLSVQTGCSSSPGRIDMNILSLMGSTDG